LTSYGKTFTHAGFTNWFVEEAKAAGLPSRSSPHGLRKAAARRLAEAGCSAKQIAAVTGHRTLQEIERYTESADQALLAEDAMAALGDNA
jgi:integrase